MVDIAVGMTNDSENTFLRYFESKDRFFILQDGVLDV